MSQQTIYITGAASGIGQELACRYAKLGANLALFDLAFSGQAKSKIEAQRVHDAQSFSYFSADVTDLKGLVDEASKAAAQVGLPDLAIHCAGIQKAGVFEDVSSAEFERVVSVNLFGTRNFAQACIPLLKKNTAPTKLVFVASMAGLVGTYAYASYNASKFGVVGLAQALRMELAPAGVSVQVICPPEVDTPMVHEEHKTINPVTLKLKLMAGTLTLDKAIDDIMKGLTTRRFYIIPGRQARLTYWASRLVPIAITNAFVDRIIRNTLIRTKAPCK